MNKEEFYFDSSNGINKIHAVIWLPNEQSFPKPVGIIQLSHGMIEYIDRYDEMAAFFNEHGYVVVGNDHIGHGKSVNSEADWGYFAPDNGSACVVDDLHKLTELVKKRFPEVPYILAGHSMGSFMARRYLMTYGNELDGAVILGTGNQPRAAVRLGMALLNILSAVHGERYRSTFINRIMFGSYNRRISGAATANDWICSDSEIVEQYNRTPACTFIFTLNGFKVLMRTLMFIENGKNIARIPKELPILIASGSEDPVGAYGKSVKKVYSIYRKAGIQDVSMKLYEGCRHELHNETIRQQVYEDINKWLQLHVIKEQR